MPPPEFSKNHVWVAAATVQLDTRQAKRAILRHSIRLPERRRIDVLEVYCLEADTEFITRDGIKTLGECANTVQTVLTRPFKEFKRPRRSEGRWVDARIGEFGRQPLLRVHLARGDERKTIRATPNHRWIASLNGNGTLLPPRWYLTRDLAPGMVLAALAPRGMIPLRWHVTGVEDKGEFEPVYCATVPSTGTFTLAGHIWVGNCEQCRRPWDDVYGEPCIAAETNEHLRGGPIGVRAKRKHDHRCDLLGCDVEKIEKTAQINGLDLHAEDVSRLTP